MSQPTRSISLTPKSKLPGLPSAPLTPTQQLEAIRRVQSQAEHRIKLGLQLFKAAEAHATHQQRVIQQVKKEQSNLREQLQDDVTRSLHAYDQWVGKIDESFTRAMQSLEQKITRLEGEWDQTQTRLQTMMRRCEAMMNQSRYMLDDVKHQRALARTKESPIEVKAPSIPQAKAPQPLKAAQESPQTPSPKASSAWDMISAGKPKKNADHKPVLSSDIIKPAPPATPAESEVRISPPKLPLAVKVDALDQPKNDEQASNQPLSVSPSMLEQAQSIIEQVNETKDSRDDAEPSASNTGNDETPISYTDIISRFGQPEDTDTS